MTSQVNANTSNNNNSSFVTSQENINPLQNNNLNMTSQVNNDPLFNNSNMTSQISNDPLFNNASGTFCYEGMDGDFDEFMQGLTVCLRTKFYLRF